MFSELKVSELLVVLSPFVVMVVALMLSRGKKADSDTDIQG